MIVPCMVNSWLYCSRLTNCMPGDIQFGADDQRHGARDEEVRERLHQVECS